MRMNKPTTSYDKDHDFAKLTRALFTQVDLAENNVAYYKEIFDQVCQWVWDVDYLGMEPHQENMLRRCRTQLAAEGYLTSSTNSSRSWYLSKGPRFNTLRKFLIENSDWGAPEGSFLQEMARWANGAGELENRMTQLGGFKGVTFTKDDIGMPFALFDMLLNSGRLVWLPTKDDTSGLKPVKATILYSELMAEELPSPVDLELEALLNDPDLPA